MLRRIQTIDRFNFKDAFSSENPYLLITIRKPGTRFVRIPEGSNCVEQCRLMFHEHDGFEFNSNGIIVPLCDRQATKLVDFVFQNRKSAPLLVIQSEYTSQQCIAIAQCLSRWLGLPVDCDEVVISPDPTTLATVQRAVATRPLEINHRGETPFK